MHLAVDITGLNFRFRTGIGRILEEYLRRWLHALHVGEGPLERISLLAAQPFEPAVLQGFPPDPRVRLFASRIPSSYVWRAGILGRQARRCGADLLYIPEPIAPVSLQVPLVCTVNDFFFRDIPENEPRHILLIYRALAPMAIRRAAALPCISRHTLGRLEHYYPACAARSQVVYPGCGFADFDAAGPDSEPAIAALRRRLGLPGTFALFAGAATLRKNIARVFRAAAQLGSNGFDLPIVVAGPPSPYARRAAQEANVRPLYTGYLSDADLANLYRAAGVLAFPSLEEGFGFPIVEAMAAGTPVVTASTGATGEIAGDAACLVDPASVDDIALGLRRCVEDRAYAETLIERGRKRARMFDWEQSAGRMLEIFAKAAQ